jgi:hypothetical protein
VLLPQVVGEVRLRIEGAGVEVGGGIAPLVGLLAQPGDVVLREILSSLKAETSREIPSTRFFPKEGSHA